MLSSQIPVKFVTPFGSGATPADILTPLPNNPPGGGRASVVSGFPDPTFQPLASGGNPPYGADMNGILNMATAWLWWAAAGGFPVGYDASFQASIGGYPRYALIRTAAGDRYWISDAENNLTDPDTGGAGWHLFPDVIVQAQAGNWANDIGTSGTNYRVTLTPEPASLAAIKGAPIRFFAAHSNTLTNPVITIDNVAGNGPVTMINSNGSPLLQGQIARVGQVCEGYYDGTQFQLTSPPPITAAGPSGIPVVTGIIYEWPSETVPNWGFECNGAVLAIASFPALFGVIGNRFPGGDGVNTFALPDKRGAFTRGWDHGRGLDPGATTRTRSPNGAGGVVGDHVGSWEQQQLRVADFNGSKILIYGDPALNLAPVKGAIPGQGIYAVGWQSNDFLGVIGGVDPPSYGGFWSALSGTTPGGGSIGFDPNGQGGSPATSIGLGAMYELAGLVFFTGAPGAETRPINIDMMYVIAF